MRIVGPERVMARALLTPGAVTQALVPKSLRATVRALRPRQWIKNGLLFVALAFTSNLHRIDLLLLTISAFAIFCALSSAGYLLNDVADVEADRRHPTKRFRPIAAGQVPVPLALGLGVALAVGGIVWALALDRRFAILAAGYLLLTAAYTLWMKHIVILDVFGISAGFVLRAAAGAVAIGVPVSPWLYTATMLGALLVALGKRRAELQTLGDGATGHRRILDAYSTGLIDQLMLIVSGAAVVTYALYTFSAANLPQDHTMMLTLPVVMYGLFRYLYLAHEGGAAGAPEQLLLQDRPLLAAVAVWAILSVSILYVARW